MQFSSGTGSFVKLSVCLVVFARGVSEWVSIYTVPCPLSCLFICAVDTLTTAEWPLCPLGPSWPGELWKNAYSCSMLATWYWATQNSLEQKNVSAKHGVWLIPELVTWMLRIANINWFCEQFMHISSLMPVIRTCL